MKTHKKLLIPLVSLLGAALVVGGLFLILRLSRKPANVYAVSEFIDYGGYNGENTLSGEVRTDRLQTVYLSETQEVTKLLVEEGQQVRKGEALMEFNTSLTDLQLKRKELEIQKLEQELAKDNKEYKSLTGKEYQPTAAVVEDAIRLSMPAGTLALPRLRLLSEIETETAELETDPVETEPVETEPTETQPVESTEPTETQPIESTEPVESTEPTETEPVDENVVETYAILGGSGTADNPYLIVVADGYALEDSLLRSLVSEAGGEACVVFAQTEEDRKDGTVLSAWGMVLTAQGSGYTLRLADAKSYEGKPLAPAEDPLVEPDEPGFDPGYSDPGYYGGGDGMSAAERQKRIKELQSKMKDLDIRIRMTKVEYSSMEAELGDGKIYADFDGVVMTVGDPETAYQNREPVLKISGGGGYEIHTAVDELSLNKVQPGMTMTVVNYWDGYEEYEGTVESVADYPTANSFGYSANQNLSYYPVVLTVPAEANLQDGYWVDINMNQATDEGGFYLMKAFVLQENGKSYVFVRGENGRLEKREIATGRELWGYQIQVLGGLSEEDYIAFPYGKTVTEGAKTVESDSSTLWGN